MSLQGIFDPVVRTYFKKKYANSGGTASDIMCVAYYADREYEETVHDGMLVKISDLAPSAEDLEGAIIVASNPEGGDIFPFVGFYPQVEAPFDNAVMASVPNAEVGFMVILNDGYFEEFECVFSKGIWAVSSFTSFLIWEPKTT